MSIHGNTRSHDRWQHEAIDQAMRPSPLRRFLLVSFCVCPRLSLDIRTLRNTAKIVAVIIRTQNCSITLTRSMRHTLKNVWNVRTCEESTDVLWDLALPKLGDGAHHLPSHFFCSTHSARQFQCIASTPRSGPIITQCLLYTDLPDPLPSRTPLLDPLRSPPYGKHLQNPIQTLSRPSLGGGSGRVSEDRLVCAWTGF